VRVRPDRFVSRSHQIEFGSPLVPTSTLCRERDCKVNAKRRKFYPREFQLLAVENTRTCANVKELAKELGVTRRCL
jgi:hypothetical protein